jgi:hypothetical protein
VADAFKSARRKPVYFLPRFLPSDANVVGALEIEPKLRAGAEPVSKAQSRITGDAAMAMDDLRYPIGRHIDLPGQFGRSNAEFTEFIGKNFTGMNRWTGHGEFTSQ